MRLAKLKMYEAMLMSMVVLVMEGTQPKGG